MMLLNNFFFIVVPAALTILPEYRSAAASAASEFDSSLARARQLETPLQCNPSCTIPSRQTQVARYEGAAGSAELGDCTGFFPVFEFGCADSATVHLFRRTALFGRDLNCEAVSGNGLRGFRCIMTPTSGTPFDFQAEVDFACYGQSSSEISSFISVNGQAVTCVQGALADVRVILRTACDAGRYWGGSCESGVLEDNLCVFRDGCNIGPSFPNECQFPLGSPSQFIDWTLVPSECRTTDSLPISPPTPDPVPPPTPLPTRPPTPNPVPAPSPLPTRPPTPSPLPAPTRDPTPSPLPAPTRDPTPSPLPAPTRDPTPSPLPEPTRDPTPSPVPEPTRDPTPTPAVAPTTDQLPASQTTPTPPSDSSSTPIGLVVGIIVGVGGVLAAAFVILRARRNNSSTTAGAKVASSDAGQERPKEEPTGGPNAEEDAGEEREGLDDMDEMESDDEETEIA